MQASTGPLKRLRELMEIAAAIDEAVLTPTRVDGTRWVEHRRRAILSLMRNHPAVVTHLSEIGSDERADVKKADAAKARGWIRKITTYKFLLHVGLYLDILGELAYLSLTFQRDVSIPEVMEGLTASKAVMSDMITTDGPHLTTIRMECSRGVYRGISLAGMEYEDVFMRDRASKVQPVLQSLEDRFSSIFESEVLRAVLKLDPKSWPEDVAGHGDEEVAVLLTHFKEVLIPNGCDIDDALTEWPRLKKIVQRNLPAGMKWDDVWGRVRRDWQEFSNILQLFEVLQVLPLATAKLERAFSLMNRVKIRLESKYHG